VLADLYFAKVWLARRFTVHGVRTGVLRRQLADAVRRGAFTFAMCTTRFMYIWTKRQFVGEMAR
jgi:hypothetical protein